MRSRIFQEEGGGEGSGWYCRINGACSQNEWLATQSTPPPLPIHVNLPLHLHLATQLPVAFISSYLFGLFVVLDYLYM